MSTVNNALPPALLEHCNVHFEEQLYIPALSLLSSAAAARNEQSSTGRLPPPHQIALAATLMVHPRMTTHTTSRDRHDASRAAQSFTTTAVHTFKDTPSITSLRAAFRFNRASGSRHRSERAKARGSTDTDSIGVDSTHIQHAYANEQSIWNNAIDFWAVVGWAFNCSILHRQRWEHWKPWLELVVDVLRADLNNNIEDPASLLNQYMLGFGNSRNNKRRVMRALFADASPKSLAEFGEIWPNETATPSFWKDQVPRERNYLDLDRDAYGDYGDDSEDDLFDSGSGKMVISCPSIVKRDRRNPNTANRIPEVENPSHGGFGGEESIALRQELLSLLVLFSHCDGSDLDTNELLDLMAEFVRPLESIVVQSFVLPLPPFLDEQAHDVFCNMMAQPLLSSHLPTKILYNSISRDDFEKWVASSDAIHANPIDNAKLSLVVEAMLRSLLRQGALNGDNDSLQHAIERGIHARNIKASNWGGKMSRASGEALGVLKCCSDRLHLLLPLLATQ